MKPCHQNRRHNFDLNQLGEVAGPDQLIQLPFWSFLHPALYPLCSPLFAYVDLYLHLTVWMLLWKQHYTIQTGGLQRRSLWANQPVSKTWCFANAFSESLLFCVFASSNPFITLQFLQQPAHYNASFNELETCRIHKIYSTRCEHVYLL